jgi:hypothetical protein
MTDFTIKRNDTSPALRYTLSPTVDLTGASVVFHMQDRTGAAVLTGYAASIVSPATAGIVQYDPLAAHTATAGHYIGEFQVTYADSTIETFPNSGGISIHIPEDIA